MIEGRGLLGLVRLYGVVDNKVWNERGFESLLLCDMKQLLLIKAVQTFTQDFIFDNFYCRNAQFLIT